MDEVEALNEAWAAEEAEADPTLDHLRQANARLARELEQAKIRKTELVDAIYRAARDAASGLTLDKVPMPPADSREHGEEVAVAVVSDWQLSKTTPTYNTEVCEERVNRYAEKVLELTAIQRADHPVKHLRVWLVGDLVEGELIFPGQAHLIDASLYKQVTIDGPRILCGFLRRMLTAFETIHVVAVIGNHGALGGKARRDYNPTTNSDRMLYRICQMVLEHEPRITWTIPDAEREREWYAVDRVGSKGVLLFHGDQIRGHSGIPWYGFSKKVLGWATGAVPQPFDYAVCGHFHQPVSFNLNYKLVYVNGSTESGNTYAQEQLAAAGRPCQWLLFMHPKHGITANYRVWLDDQPGANGIKRARAKRAASAAVSSSEKRPM